MRQRYHLLIQSVIGDESLVQRHAGRWLLPICGADPSSRPGVILQRAMTQAGIRGGVPIAIPYGSYSAEHHEMDWLGVTATPTRVAGHALEWVPIGLLEQQPSVSEFQAEALHRYLAARDFQSGYLDPEWPDAAREWIDRQLEAHGRCTSGKVWVFRCSPSYVGARFLTNTRPVYFKAVCPGAGFAEAALSHWLWRHSPDSFAPTVHADLEGGRWLADHVDGVLLRKKLSGEALDAVVTNIAALQSLHVERVDHIRALGAWPHSLEDVGRDSIQLIHQSSTSKRTRDVVVEVILRTLDRVANLGLPQAWVPLDLGPDNIIMSGHRPVFIDVGDCWIGPAPAVLEALSQNLRASQPTHHLLTAAEWHSIRQRYVESWHAQFPMTKMMRGLELMPLVVCMVQSLRGLDLLRRRIQRGEIAGLEEHARRLIVRRITDVAESQAEIP